MGLDMHGWVEVFDATSKRWTGVLLFDHLVSRNYTVYAALFGLEWSKFLDLPPATTRRGLPDDLSLQARYYVLHTEAILEGKQTEQSWLLWSEIRQLDPEETGLDKRRNEIVTRRTALTHSPDWRMFFDLLGTLEQRYTPEHLRIVVWLW